MPHTWFGWFTKGSKKDKYLQTRLTSYYGVFSDNGDQYTIVNRVGQYEIFTEEYLTEEAKLAQDHGTISLRDILARMEEIKFTVDLENVERDYWRDVVITAFEARATERINEARMKAYGY